MNRTIFTVLAVAFCLAAVEALQCYKCPVGFWGVCITSTTTCAAGEHCYSGKGEAVGFVDIMKKGCLAEAECNQTSSVTFPTGDNDTVYKMHKVCCNTDLCNSAPAGLPGALQLALASILAVFATNALI